MNKLSKKFTYGIIIILVLSSGCSIVFNTKFLEKYYLSQKKAVISSMCEQLAGAIEDEIPADEVISQIESSEKVMIVRTKGSMKESNNEINDEIRSSFQEKGIGFQKYWLWEEDYENILNGNNRIRLYNQEKLNYSLLVEYTLIDSELYVIAMIIPNISDAFGIINTFLILVNAATIILAIIFIIILIQRITRPLQAIENFASNMKKSEFKPLEVHTNDELESVADQLNSMGAKIISYQESLQAKNEQMEQLLDNVSHDLKTPVSLIQLYADGMKDGLDDGTFLDTIILKNKQMAEMIQKLLYVSGIDKKDVVFCSFNLTVLLQKLIHDYTILAGEHNITIAADLELQAVITSSSEMIESLFGNLITNAIKYSSGPQIDIKLYADSDNILLSVTNETDHKELDLSKIWEPYYVGEQSRNKNLSGTGLGLVIVQRICKLLYYSVQCSVWDGKITFQLTIPRTPHQLDAKLKEKTMK